MPIAYCAQQTFLQLHDLSIVFSVNFDCEILCLEKCLHVVVYWEMSLCFVKCGAVLNLRAIILLGKRSFHFDRGKKVEARGEVEHTERQKKGHMTPPSLQHVEMGKGHTEGPGQIRDRKGCILCDTDQLFP